MPRHGLRSRSKRRRHLVLPGGKKTIHYMRRAYGRGRCASCGEPLRGVTSQRQTPKSSKRPSRPYGGVLCHNCLRTGILQATRES
ncbi:MAG TPA: 50S ribosomal protein L34e [Methylomirabilota bacterium]|nr:50S ribosomal protein L34e [Methylomirabilota bacterium]